MDAGLERDANNDAALDTANELKFRVIALELELGQSRSQVESLKSQITMMQQIIMEDTSIGDPSHHAPSSSSGEAYTEQPLAAAASRGDVATVLLLLCEPTAACSTPVVAAQTEDRQRTIDNALLVACRHGQTSTAEALISHGGDVQVDFGSCLMWACHARSVELIELLIANGADVNALRGCPMRIALRQGAPSVVQLLVSHGGRVDA